MKKIEKVILIILAIVAILYFPVFPVREKVFDDCEKLYNASCDKPHDAIKFKKLSYFFPAN